MKNIKMVLFDIDNTLVFGKNATTFYRQYSTMLEKTLALLLHVEFDVGKRIADEHRAAYGGRGELSFETHGLDLTSWHDALMQMNPSAYLEPLPHTQKLLKQLRSEKYIIGAISDGPELLIEKIFAATEIDPALFDFIIGWERDKPMPKYGRSAIFEQVCDLRTIARNETVMIGDSLGSDVLPALRAGLHAIHIGVPTQNQNKSYITIPDITTLPDYL